MSKNKKKKQKRVNPETVIKVKTGFATLISNDAVIKASREWKGAIDILPVAIALASIVLAVLPTFVSRMNTQGSSVVFSTPTANYEQGVSSFLETLVYDGNAKRNLSLVINQNGHFEISDADRIALTGGNESWYTLSRTIEGVKTPQFEVFFNTTGNSDELFYKDIDANNNPYTSAPRDTSAGAKAEYRASYLAFGTDSIRFRKRNTTTVFTGLTGRYDRLRGFDFTAKALELQNLNLEASDADYVLKARDFFADVINRAYETDRNTAAWQYTGIFAAIDLGLILLFGLLLFLMTRGKKNPFRIYTFWETQKMAYWASFTPALISLALGFWLVQYAFIIFMFTYGMRMMWMSMRSMRPTPAQ